MIKEGKFINVVKGLTIFINSQNENGTFNNIFLDDSSKSNSKMIYAKSGLIVDNNQQKVFKLYDGRIINKEKNKINVFDFDQIDFNLADFSSYTILVPKIQERRSTVLLKCSLKNEGSNLLNVDRKFRCEKKLSKEVDQELFKRFYKPLYIPIIALLCCFLIVVPKNNITYEKYKRYIFIITLLILILSEASLRYSTSSNLTSIMYLILPWISFLIETYL